MFISRLLVVSKNSSLKSIKNIKKLSLIQELNSSNNNFSSSSNFKDESSEQNTYSLFNLRKSLKLSGLEFVEGPTNIKLKECPVCFRFGEEDCGTKEKNEKSIYINKTTGTFICPGCQYNGKYGLIEKFLTASSKSQKSINDLKTYQKLFFNSKESYQTEHLFDPTVFEKDSELVTLENVQQVIDWFEIHEKISKNTLISLRIRYNKIKNELLVPLLDIQDKVVGYKIITKLENGNGSSFHEKTVPDSNCSGLVVFNNSKSVTNPNRSSTKAILVLNVFDLLALTQTKINASFICLPYSLKFLPQECLPALDKYQELILWFNYDTAGWDVARNFAKKLDEKRCLFVRPTNAQPTPYKALLKSLDIKNILSSSQPILHKAITTFSSLRQDVLSDLQNIDKVQGVKWKRYPTLNKYLKGHRKGELTILTGTTGCGKTTFMSDYSLDLAMQGVTTLWGSFEIRNTRLATTLLRQFAGKPLFDSNKAEDLVEFDNWANKFEELPIYFMTFHGEQQIKVVMEAIEHAQYVNDINHVIIDNVQFMMGIAEEPKHIDRFWKQDVIIAAFRTFATRKNCHVTLVIHPRKEKDNDDLTTSSIFGGAKATQEADNVLIIQDKRLTSVRGKKYLQIAKNRYSGDLGIMPLEFDKLSLSYAQKAKKKSPEEPQTADASQKIQTEPES